SIPDCCRQTPWHWLFFRRLRFHIKLPGPASSPRPAFSDNSPGQRTTLPSDDRIQPTGRHGCSHTAGSPAQAVWPPLFFVLHPKNLQAYLYIFPAVPSDSFSNPEAFSHNQNFPFSLCTFPAAGSFNSFV